MANVLILGGGGREHALAWKLQQSPKVQTIFIAPGNSAPFENVDLDPSDASSISRFCATASIDLVLVGPEAPLSTGVVDKLRSLNHNAKVFGPTQRAAALETSKKYAKKFMVDFGLITARYFEATTQQQADQIIDECNWSGIVVKADGLAAGKGVFVADNKADAKRAAGLILKNGVGGGQLLLEEKLDGYEVSALAFVDGKSFARLPLARDYKRLLNGDRGPNTGN